MSEPLLLENLDAAWAEWKYGRSKPVCILRSVSATVSVISSSLLIWMIMRSKERLTTTYHRLLFGLSISDIIISLSLMTFGATTPSEMSYLVWNAQGNKGTCDAQGFLCIMGSVSGILYICSLNLYYLAKVKYNKGDRYISSKLEPFLHGVPIVIALVYSITFLAMHNYNTSPDGSCNGTPVHQPPHCIGYEDGQVPEGFEIPCGRGRGGEILFRVSGLFILWIPPIVVGISLGMIFRFVHKQENRIGRYGAGAVNTADSAGVSGRSKKISLNSVVSSVRTCFRKKSSNEDHQMSRAVVNRALMYSSAYFLAWGWAILYTILNLAGVWDTTPTVYVYFWVIFNSSQGFFNLLIFVHPKVKKAKRSSGENISWCGAFARVLLPGVDWGKKKTQKTAVTVVNTSIGGNRNNAAATLESTTAGITKRKADHHDSPLFEEEKTEIQAPLDHGYLEPDEPTDDNFHDNA